MYKELISTCVSVAVSNFNCSNTWMTGTVLEERLTDFSGFWRRAAHRRHVLSELKHQVGTGNSKKERKFD